MDRNLEHRALEIFERSIDLSVSSRVSFLEDACRDDAVLRRHVEALLETLEDDTQMGALPTAAATLAYQTREHFEVGTTLAERYQVEGLLGSGGMGEVYCALDTRLERKVAIKVLNRKSRENDELCERFEREIKAVAALTHSNIVTLFDTSTFGGTSFAVMELIEGETLRSLIGSGLDWKTACRFALGIAEALNVAHAQSVIHRDIKPDNVMVDSSGTVKVLDFGLAKPADHLGKQGITTDAATPGTVPYMSPEQTNGSPLEESTDIFSLGTTFFEMLAGRNPFRAGNAFATMQRINGRAPQINNVVSNLPSEIASLIDEMLHPSAQHRPSASKVIRTLRLVLELDSDAGAISVTAGSQRPDAELATDVKRADSTSTQSGRPSIAVLPLQSFTADPNHRFLGDAIAQEVIIELARLNWLSVIARGSSFQFRDPDVNLSDVGSVLGARYVLTGTVEMMGSQGAVYVELIRASDQQMVWAERLPVTLDDLMQVRHKIAANITVSIESRVQTYEFESAQRIGTENLDAWGAYHRGLWHMYRFKRDDNLAATELFSRAVEIDPRFARAHAGLSFTHFQEAFLRFSDNDADELVHQELAQSYAEKSLELDPLDPFTNLTMGRAAWLSQDLDGASSWFGRSLEICPNYAFAWYNQSLTQALQNHGEQAEEGATKAMSLSPIDPLTYAMNGTIALSHVVRGDYEKAIPWSTKALTEPTAHVHMWLIAAMVHQLAGQTEAAAKFAAKVRKMRSGYSQDQFLQVFAFRDEQTLGRCKQALHQLAF